MRSKPFVSSLMVLCGIHGWAAIDLLSPTTEWNVLPYSGQEVFSDYTLDTQANSPDLDLVGYDFQYAVYTKFDPVDSLMAFRIRVAGDKNPAGFKGQLWVGADVNQDGNVDIFVGTDSTSITLNYGSDGDNTSPGTTSIDTGSPVSTIPVTSANYDWAPVTATNDPGGAHTDIDGFLNPKSKSGVDYFLTFSIRFDEFAAAVNNLDYVDGFTAASSIAYVVGTATQSNSLNSDISGIYGSTDSMITWTNLGAISSEISMSGGAVPEPASTALVLAGLSFLILIVRRRRS